MKTLLVIDGNSILNRQFFGIRPLTTKSGIFTNAVYGFLNVLSAQLEKLHPDYCAVAFDVHAPTFRHKKYDLYKAGRRPTPPELLMQFPYTKQILTALGIAVIEKEGYEADDVLGTLSKLAEDDGDVFTYLLTGDRDSLQLISDKTHVLYASTGETVDMGRDEFFAKYTITPEQFVDLKALMGDSSDHIPGVPGVGEKTAVKMISTAGSLDEVYAHPENLGLSPKMLEKLVSGKESAYLSQWLSRIERNAPLGLSLDDVKIGACDCDALDALLTELELSKMRERFLSSKKPKEIAIEEIGEKDLPLLASDEDLSICEENGDVFVYVGGKNYVSRVTDFQNVAALLEKHRGKFHTHDCKRLLHLIENADTDAIFEKLGVDVMLGAYTINAGDESFSLERLSTAYLGKTLPVNGAAIAIGELVPALLEKMEKDGVLSLYEGIEKPLARVLFGMEKRGFLIDRQALDNYGRHLDEGIGELIGQIYQHAGHEFNIQSPKQLGAVLFDEIGLPALKKTKSGYATGAEILEKLLPYHPIVGLILDYRKLTKLRATYVEGLLKVADDKGRVHTSFKQTGTATGRLSSAEPNLQNIPIRTEIGKELRSFFVAKEGSVLIDADYSQIELRLLAAIARDPNMIGAFLSGEDIHADTASKVFGVPRDAVTPEMRKRAKAINFGIMYGMGDYSLSQDLNISRREAGDFIAAYKGAFPKIDEYLKNTVAKAYEDGYVTTLSKRRRYIPDLASPQKMLRAAGERVAMNSPIQGSAADVIKLAMIRIDSSLKEAGLDARLILQVHDELIIECAEKDAEAAKEILIREMEGAAELKVPLTVAAGIGKNWLECH